MRERGPVIGQHEGHTVAGLLLALILGEKRLAGVVGFGDIDEDKTGARGVVANPYAGGWKRLGGFG